MRVLKELGLVIVGMLVMLIVFLGVNYNFRIAALERNQGQIVGVLNKILQPVAQQQQAKAKPAGAPVAPVTPSKQPIQAVTTDGSKPSVEIVDQGVKPVTQ